MPVLPGRARQEADLRLERPAARSVLDDSPTCAGQPDRGEPAGLLAERFAVLPDDAARRVPAATAEALRPSGYRPIRFRPYADGAVVRVAAVWTRDGRKWRIGVGARPPNRSAGRTRRTGRQIVPPRRCRRVRDAGATASPPTAMRPSGSTDPRRRRPALSSGSAGETADRRQSLRRLAQLISHAARPRAPTARLRYCGVWGSRRARRHVRTD